MTATSSWGCDWKRIFSYIGQQVRKNFESVFPGGTPAFSGDLAAVRDAVYTLCGSVDVALITVSETRPPLWTLVQFHLSAPREEGVRLVSVLTSAEAANRFAGLEADDLVCIRKPQAFLRWHERGDVIVHLVPCDIAEDPAKYAQELSRDLLEPFNGIFQQRLSRGTDFVAKYGLPSEPVLSYSSMVGRADARTAAFLLDFNIRSEFLIEDWQGLVSNILLIPQVTGSIKRTFQIAKQLFVFSVFEYSFATVSQHYAGLALESAVQNRWNLTLPPTVTLKHKQEEVCEQMPSYRHIKHLCRQRHWDPRKVAVDGKPFPDTIRKLLGYLESCGIITPWQRRRIEFGVDNLRNPLSHLEFAPLHPPSPQSLTFVAELINQLFDSLPVPPPVRGWATPQF